MSTPAGGPGGPAGPGGGDRLGPTPARLLLVLVVVGLAGGSALRPLAQVLGQAPPRVSLLQVVALWFAAAALGVVAWTTWRVLQRGQGRLAPHQAVNRLVLAKASAVVGALVAGGYAGYALAFLGRPQAELVRERVVNGAVGSVGAALVVVAALLLERACRTRDPGPGDLP